jgi:hypothetical protein
VLADHIHVRTKLTVPGGIAASIPKPSGDPRPLTLASPRRLRFRRRRRRRGRRRSLRNGLVQQGNDEGVERIDVEGGCLRIDDLAVPIDDVAGRNGAHVAVGALEVLDERYPELRRQGTQLEFGYRILGGDRQNLEAVLAVVFEVRLEQGKFPPARRAPGGLSRPRVVARPRQLCLRDAC